MERRIASAEVMNNMTFRPDSDAISNQTTTAAKTTHTVAVPGLASLIYSDGISVWHLIKTSPLATPLQCEIPEHSSQLHNIQHCYFYSPSIPVLLHFRPTSTMLFRRKETPWEVVESHSVDPVPMYYDDEGRYLPHSCQGALVNYPFSPDLDLIFAKDSNVLRKFVLDVQKGKVLQEELQKAVVFARERLLEEIKKNGYNVLLLERYDFPCFFMSHPSDSVTINRFIVGT